MESIAYVVKTKLKNTQQFKEIKYAPEYSDTSLL